MALAALVLAACAEQQQVRTIHHWNTTESMLYDAEPSDGGLQVIRRTAVRTALEAYDADGNITRRAYTDKPISAVLAPANGVTSTDRLLNTVLVTGATIYYAEEISPARNRIMRLDPDGAKNVVSTEGNWTQIVEGPGGDVFGIESLFLSRDAAPSACRLYNLTKGAVALEDNASYQYPFAGRMMLLVSPIDRRVRILEGGKAREVGSITSLDFPPIVSPDGRSIVWFGPGGSGSALYACDAAGKVSTFQPQMTERPIAWIGTDLMIADQDALTARWIVKRIGVADGLVKATIPIPSNVSPRRMVGSPRGDFIGLETDHGSELIRLADGFIQEFDPPLSAWRFSRDGARLWLVTQGDLQVIDLK